MSELTLDGLKEMKKAEFVKAFKNKAAWKKANAVILLVDYKLDGKKATVAIPYRKEAEMKIEMKRLKKEKLHLMKKSGGATFSIERSAEGVSAKIELVNGGLSLQALEGKVTDLFSILKIKVQTSQSAEAAAEAAAQPAETDPNESLPDDDFSKEVPVEDDADDVFIIKDLKAFSEKLFNDFDSIGEDVDKFKALKSKDERIAFAKKLMEKSENWLNALDTYKKQKGKLQNLGGLAKAEEAANVMRTKIGSWLSTQEDLEQKDEKASPETGNDLEARVTKAVDEAAEAINAVLKSQSSGSKSANFNNAAKKKAIELYLQGKQKFADLLGRMGAKRNAMEGMDVTKEHIESMKKSAGLSAIAKKYNLE